MARFARKVIKWDFFAWFSNTVSHYGKSTLPLCISSQPSLWNWMLSTLLSAVNLSLVIWHEGSLWVLLKTVTITSWVYQISKKRGIESRGTQVHTYANLVGWPGVSMINVFLTHFWQYFHCWTTSGLVIATCLQIKLRTGNSKYLKALFKVV